MITSAGVLDLLLLALGGFLAVRARPAGTERSSELLISRLVMGFSIFFAGFYLPGVFGLYFAGSWVTIPNAVLVSAILTVAAYAWNRLSRRAAARTAAAPVESPPPLDAIARFVVVGLIGGFALLSVLLLIGFPRGFEVAAYHLPIAVNFFRDGSVRIWDRAEMHTYPANMSLWSGFWLQLLPERLASIVNIPFLGLCVVSLYRLCRLAGADKSAAVLVAGGITTVPLFGFSAAELGADVAGVGFVLAAIWLALARPRSLPDWPLLAGAAGGLAFGFKSLHLVGAGLVALWVLFGPRDADDTASPPRTRIVQAASFTAAFFALSGVWLLRNQLELGNPLYPVSLPFLSDLLGFTSAPDFRLEEAGRWQYEWVNQSWQWLVYPWVEGHYIHQNFKNSSGLGPFFAATVPTAWLAWSVMLLGGRWRHERNGANDAALGLYLIGTTTFAVWWMLDNRQPRYVMAGIAELLPLAAVLLACSSAILRRAYETTLALSTLFALTVLVLHVGVEEGSLLQLGRLPTRAEAYEYPPQLDGLPPGTVILDLEYRTSHYALYGAKLTNRVISYPEATRLFYDGEAWDLKPQEIRQLGITYAYAEGDPKLSPGCVGLEPYARLERNPFNSQPLLKPRTLYRIVDNCPPDQR